MINDQGFAQLHDEDPDDEPFAETGIMLLLTPTELAALHLMSNRYVPLDRDPAIGTLRDKIAKAMEAL